MGRKQFTRYSSSLRCAVVVHIHPEGALHQSTLEGKDGEK